jgi:hypothetical protein
VSPISFRKKNPEEKPGVLALMSAPRAMLAWTDWLVSADPDSDTGHAELPGDHSEIR